MSDQDTSIFNADPATTVTTQTSDVPPASSTSPLVSELVGEGKKYKTVDDLASSVSHAQAHITRLEEEAKTLREAATEQLNAEKVLRELQQKTADDQAAKEQPPQVDFDDQRVLDIIAQNDQTKLGNANIQAVDKLWKETYGDKAEEVLIAKSKELGFSLTKLKEVAQSSPRAFYNMVGLSGSNSNASSLQSSFNTSTMSGSTSDTKNFAYYQKIRKTDPAEYTRVNPQMMKDAAAQGANFFKS